MSNRHHKTSSPLDLLLGSRTRSALPVLFFEQPSAGHGIREAAAKATLDYKSARRELLRLKEAGVLSSRVEGNRRVFRLDGGFRACEELRGLVLQCAGRGIVRLLEREPARVSGVEAAVLYGSLARGGEVPESDLGLLLVGEMEDGDFLPVARRLEAMIGHEVEFVIYTREEFACGDRGYRALTVRLDCATSSLQVGAEVHSSSVVRAAVRGGDLPPTCDLRIPDDRFPFAVHLAPLSGAPCVE